MKRCALMFLLGLLGMPVAPASEEFFEAKVLPVLQKRCFECHSHEGKIKGGLALDSRAGWESGGDHGPAILPGEVEESLLIKAVRYGDDDLQMPPKSRLPDSELRLLEQWVELGAPDPRKAATGVTKREIDLEAGRKHWAFQPVTDPPVPKVGRTEWPLDPLDRFLLAKLEAEGLAPVNDADRYTWLRRVSLDLTGLPPTPAEIEAFVSDRSGLALERVVDRLLNSKAYGERWARHWLDLTGYADMM
ncbi:MAG: DUF1549 domain-containing protein, partial [Verrucomicrobiae bacterium]|nr:DUF1549 domain-containing protein [Verrucomicrobiae bacterium]